MILLQLITYNFLHCEQLHSLTAAIGTVIGIGFIFAFFVMLLCLYYHKVWKPKHGRTPVSGRVAFDGHGGVDESYVMIDFQNVSHLSTQMLVHCTFQ